VLAETLGLTGSEIASVAGALQSQLHVSLARLLTVEKDPDRAKARNDPDRD
jgi:hypothetical protein